MLSMSWLYKGSKPPAEYMTLSVVTADTPMQHTPERAAWTEMTYDTELSAKEFEMLLNKIIAVYEETTALLADEAKTRHRMSMEDIAKSRQVVQWWCQSGKPVLSKSVPEETLKEIEVSILLSNNLDLEVTQMLSRRPAVFHAQCLWIVLSPCDRRSCPDRRPLPTWSGRSQGDPASCRH